jgi:hypothetical protein
MNATDILAAFAVAAADYKELLYVGLVWLFGLKAVSLVIFSIRGAYR